MTTKPSAAPWADEPYKLLPTPSTYIRNVRTSFRPSPVSPWAYACGSLSEPSSLTITLQNPHSAVFAASEMAYSHNCLLRGLNAIVQQAPHIPEAGSPGHSPQDVTDLLYYVEAWTKTVDHHHETEEKVLFPRIEELAGTPGLMEVARGQHEAFHGGLETLHAYATRTGPQPAEYRWQDLKGIIDGLAPALVAHLTEEIDVLLALEAKCESEGLRKVWKEAEDVAKANGNLGMLVSPPSSIVSHYTPGATGLTQPPPPLQYEVFPLVLGTCDKTYEGGNAFPPLPGVIPYAIKYWFGRSHTGAWRFNPCDFWGKPVPLAMLPENRPGVGGR